MATMNSLPMDPDWWRGAVIYQIYPRSFQDSSGDGIGDLKGIIQRLDYVAKLGADAIWISPFFKSPMKDFGYDVSDYRDVDPMFGTLADFDALVAKAHGLGLRVMIDLVLSHTSDQHDWFKESRQSLDNAKSNWFVWADPKPDGTPPNNWLSIFGGPAWTWDSRRCQYYLHNFLSTQPDLNFHEPEVQEALLDVARFWLKRGVDGFRLDTINFYFADKELRDNPALPPEKRNDTIAPSVNPYNHQEHIYSKNQPENIEFLRKFRSVLNEYGAAAVGEVGDAQRGLEIMGQYTRGDDLVQMCYAFEFLANAPLTAARVVEVLTQVDAVASDGWPCWAFSNHDVVRHATRWNLSPEAQRLFALLLLSLRGSVCLYQGEELGLQEADVAFDDLQDPYGIEFWPEFKGRDGCRTPMVWERTNQNAGFSQGKPWLPVAPEHLRQSVEDQEAVEESLLAFYRAALAFRKAHPVLATGDHANLRATGNVLSFERKSDDAHLLCVFNLSGEAADVPMDVTGWEPLGNALGLAQGNELAPWQGAIFRRVTKEKSKG
ncbi:MULTISPECIES: alpha-amylase family glycosyl hydrolase [Halocynthiibacter]|uniref:Alpha-amylase family glycosyl hydrolase n=1 Tax=Halocynthiibacter halioticoli TaxID=2986804 RepID=A0AAE3LRD7_9RHOB|nr:MULTISPECIES: alpha-amylase family glycosyl hydrolase [Halocynthiibacter]MCV6824473.1 alpha-amylase family glycosyl hydrolase [Halocynthiibacter halioticoli]MCW4057474.1 alpha-amylase family glycosyl hydrolase [Halocynthiibacter sp. SDUM655004]